MYRRSRARWRSLRVAFLEPDRALPGALSLMRLGVRIGALVALTALSLTGGPAPARSQSAPPPIPTVTKPATYIDVLRNFKMAIDGGLLLNPEFVSDPALISFFGDGKIIRHQGIPDGVSGEIANIFLKADPSNWSVAVDFRLTMKPECIEGTLRIRHRSVELSLPTFDDIEAVFGRGWTHLFEPPSAHGGRIPATAPHGNDVIVYESAGTSLKTQITFRFSHDARIWFVGGWVAEARCPDSR